MDGNHKLPWPGFNDHYFDFRQFHYAKSPFEKYTLRRTNIAPEKAESGFTKGFIGAKLFPPMR